MTGSMILEDNLQLVLQSRLETAARRVRQSGSIRVKDAHEAKICEILDLADILKIEVVEPKY